MQNKSIKNIIWSLSCHKGTLKVGSLFWRQENPQTRVVFFF